MPRTTTNATFLTVPQCEAQCGTGYYPYASSEVVNAVATWMLPLFLLIGNIEYSNFDLKLRRKKSSRVARLGLDDVLLSHVFIACRLLGNPIRYIHSHLEKLDDIRDIRRETSDKSAAIVCIALRDFPDTSNHVLLIQEAAKRGDDRILAACKRSALLLAKSRASSTRRSLLAIIIYATTLFISLVSAMKEDSIPVHSPHTLALRVLYYWLITAVVVSSATGAFPTEYTAWAALQPALDALEAPVRSNPLTELEYGSYRHKLPPAFSLPSMALAAVAVASVVGAWAVAFTMSWIIPARGLGCRSFLEIGYLLTWRLNFVLSFLLARTPRFKLPWIEIFVDILIAFPTVVMLFVAWKGYFNSCKCWGTVWTLPDGIRQRIPADLAHLERDLRPTYFGLIGAALAIQALIAVGILLYYWRELRLIYSNSRSFLQQVLPAPRSPNSSTASNIEMDLMDVDPRSNAPRSLPYDGASSADNVSRSKYSRASSRRQPDRRSHRRHC